MKKVLVGMSGGVDSSVCAILLKEQGYKVCGATMTLYKNSTLDAEKVCEKIGIPHTVFDFSKAFEKTVIAEFVNAYISGKTPNPCVTCNKFIKFGAFAEEAKKEGFDYIATGHYAKIIKSKEQYFLQKADDPEKDQSYFLYNLTQDILAYTLFPLAQISKQKIREIAEKYSLPSAHKPDSQDICFVPDKDYISFIQEYTDKEIPRGNFIDTSGNIIGRHNGIIRYTIGQRNGLGTGFGKRKYDLYKNPLTNEVILGENEELFEKKLMACDYNFISGKTPDKPIKVLAKIRYGKKQAPAQIFVENKFLFVEFDEPQRAAASGQSVVFYDFYDNKTLLGGGIIL